MKIVDISLVAKCKLVNLTAQQKLLFDQLMIQYSKACDCVSAWIFNHSFSLEQNGLQKALYYQLRADYGLKSQLAISVIRTVIAKYKTVQTQLKNNPYYYKIRDANKEKHIKAKYLRVKRDLNWLTKPIKFNTPQADLQRNRDWSYVDGKLSINTLDKREKVAYRTDYFDQYLNDQACKLGILKIIKRGKNYFAYISVTKTVNQLETDDAKHVVGLDRGLRFLYSAYDEKGKASFYSGKHVMHVRRKYFDLRKKLQKKGTKSAKRVLKRISGRENRFMSDVNHQISKALVNKYGKNTLFIIEDLAGIKSATVKCKDKEDKYQSISWAYYQLEQDLTYKARLNNSDVIKVAAQYTSQRCPKCGRICKENRDHDLHLYQCDRCGYTSNDDRLAAINIQYLGTEYRSGNLHPKFIKQD